MREDPFPEGFAKSACDLSHARASECFDAVPLVFLIHRQFEKN